MNQQIQKQIQEKVRNNLKEKIEWENTDDWYQKTWLKANKAGIAQFIKNKGHE